MTLQRADSIAYNRDMLLAEDSLIEAALYSISW